MNVKALFPILDWLPKYNAKLFKGDLSAGLTVGIMLIPQGMAYAMLAGVPPIYGLYAAIFPQLVYALMGTSRQLGVGPVAMDSLLTAVTVSQFAQVESDQYITMAILLAFLVGAIQMLMGLFRLGFLVNFLSRPVISGFTSAAALIIGFSQLKHLLGVDVAGSQYFYEIVWFNLQEIGNTNIHALWVGVVGVLVILGFKKWLPAVPAPLMVVIAGIGLVWGLGLYQYDIKIVADIPSGLPAFVLPDLGNEQFMNLLAGAFTISIVAFMEAIAVGKAIQARHKDYKIVPNQELLALGAGNMIGALFQSFPTTGGFSRSAVNDQAGARTNMAAVISALFIVVTLLFLTPLFYYLPKTVLASIIMVAVFKLINLKDPQELWKKDRQDFVVWLFTFVATLTIGIQLGILTGVLVSIALMLYRIAKPSIVFRNDGKYHEKVELSSDGETAIMRFDEQLCYVNAELFQDTLDDLIEQETNLRRLIIDTSGINYLDSTGIFVLQEIAAACQSKDIDFVLVNTKKYIRDLLAKHEMPKNLNFAKTVKQALEKKVKTSLSIFDEFTV